MNANQESAAGVRPSYMDLPGRIPLDLDMDGLPEAQIVSPPPARHTRQQWRRSRVEVLGETDRSVRFPNEKLTESIEAEDPVAAFCPDDELLEWEQELVARTRPKPTPGPKQGTRRRLPLSKVGQGDDSPSFYLSLSDLMSLLLVFFVLIFSLSEMSAPESKSAQAAAPAPQVEKAAARKLPPQAPLDLRDLNSAPAPAPAAPLRLGLVVSSGAETGAASAPAEPEKKPRRAHLAPSPDLSVNRSLLAMVNLGQSMPEGALPQKETPRLSTVVESLKQELTPALHQGMELEAARDRLVISLPEAITFDLGQADLKREMNGALARLAGVMQQRQGYRVVISGHSDDIPIANQRFASNWELSAARAAAVGRALIAQGLDRGRLTIKGMADTRPKVENSSELNRRINRRVEIELRPMG